jgi:hypothetical protein
MDPLRVNIQLKSRYAIFDASGKLPFDLVFGLRRKTDSNPHDIAFQTTYSILDVPYALAQGLLKLHEVRRTDTSPEEHFEVDISALQDAIASSDDEPTAPEYITLPSRSNRTEKRGQMGTTEYRYRIEAGSPLASCLEVGKKYSFGLLKRDLGTHRWIDVKHAPSSSETNTISSLTTDGATGETCQLVSNPHGGFAVLRVVESLTWPPPIETRMRLLLPDASSITNEQPSESDNNNKLPSHPILRVTSTNTGPTKISIQARGHQRFLSPWGPYQPESHDGLNAGHLPSILAPSSTGTAFLQVIDLATGSIVHDMPKASHGLPAGRPDRRPTLEDLVVLDPGVAFERDVELDYVVRGLGDGRYVMRLRPKGVWWCWGEVGESEPGDGGKVPKRIYGVKFSTPAVLRSEDEVEFGVRDGMVAAAGE